MLSDRLKRVGVRVLPVLLTLFWVLFWGCLSGCTDFGSFARPAPTASALSPSVAAPDLPKRGRIVFASLSGTAPRYIDSGPDRGFGWEEHETLEIRKGLKRAGFDVVQEWFTPARIASEFRRGSAVCFYPAKWQNPELTFSKRPDRIYSLPLSLEGDESHSILYNSADHHKFIKYMDQKGDLNLDLLLGDHSLRTLMVRDYDYGNLGRTILDVDDAGDQFVRPQYEKSVMLLLIKENRQLIEMLNARRFDYIIADAIEDRDFESSELSKSKFKSLRYSTVRITDVKDPRLVMVSISCGVHPSVLEAMPVMNRWVKNIRGSPWLNRMYAYRSMVDAKIPAGTNFTQSTVYNFMGQIASGATDYWYSMQQAHFAGLKLLSDPEPEGSLPPLKRSWEPVRWKMLFTSKDSVVVANEASVSASPAISTGSQAALWSSFDPFEDAQLARHVDPKALRVLLGGKGEAKGDPGDLQQFEAGTFSELPWARLKGVRKFQLFARGLKASDLLFLDPFFKQFRGLSVFEAGPEESAYLVERLPAHLTALDLTSCSLAKTQLHKKIKGMPLRSLILSNSQITATQLPVLIKNISGDIEELSLDYLRGCFTERGSEVFKTVSWKNLTSLNLNNSFLLDSNFRSIQKVIGPQIEKLYLSHNFMTPRALSPLFSRPMPKLLDLNLSHNAVGSVRFPIRIPPSCKMLQLASGQLDERSLRLLELPSKLEVLDVSHNDLGLRGIELILPRLAKKMRHLDLSQTQMGSNGFFELTEKMREIEEIDTLALSGNGLKDSDLIVLAQAPTKIRSLLLGSNLLHNGGAETIATKWAPSLEELDVSSNLLSDAGVAAIMSRVSPSMRALQLSSLISINVPGLAEKIPSGLVKLALANNSISDDEMEQLAKFLPATLKRLELGNSSLSSRGIWHLMRSLPRGLSRLNLAGNLLAGQSAKILLENLPPALSRLGFGPVESGALDGVVLSLPQFFLSLTINGLNATERQLHSIFEALPRGVRALALEPKLAAPFTFKELKWNLPSNLRFFSWTGSLSDEGLRRLSPGFPGSLEFFTLLSARIRDEGVTPLAQKSFENLFWLDLSENLLTDQGVIRLLRAQKSLVIAKWIGNMGINGQKFGQLEAGDLQRLRGLEFSNTKITEKAWIEVLKKLNPDFYLLGMSNNLISPVELGSLLKALPVTLRTLFFKGNAVGEDGKLKIRAYQNAVEEKKGLILKVLD